MKRFLAIIAVLLVLCLAGCENVEYIEKAQSAEETSADIYEQMTSQLPSLEISGDTSNSFETERVFTIVTDDPAVFIPDENSAGMISSAIEERNSFLRDTYAADIRAEYMEPDQIKDKLQAAYTSGADFCDMLAVSGEVTVSLFAAGLLEDMNTLPDFNIENSYFDQTDAKSLATNNSLYMLADSTAMVYDDAYVMFYNRDLISQAGASDPETLALQGNWTWDEMNTIARTAAADVYKKTSADLENDIFGFGAYHLETDYPVVMFSSCGHKLIDNTYKSPVQLSMEIEDVVTIADALLAHYNVKGRYPLEGNDASDTFSQGRMVFFCNKLEYLYALRDGSANGSQFGVVPMPKYNTEQSEYCCLLSSDARVISVPKTISNADESKRRFVSAIISATCATGRETMKDAFVESLIALYLNNNTEVLVLDTICDSIVYDFSNIYGSAVPEIAGPTTDAVADYLGYGSNLSSSIRQNRTAFNKYCETNFT